VAGEADRTARETDRVDGVSRDVEAGVIMIDQRHGPVLERITYSRGRIAVAACPGCVGQIPEAAVEVRGEVDAAVRVELEGVGAARRDVPAARLQPQAMRRRRRATRPRGRGYQSPVAASTAITRTVHASNVPDGTKSQMGLVDESIDGVQLRWIRA